MRGWRVAGLTATGVLGLGIAATAVAQARWASRSARVASRLAAGRAPPADGRSRPASYSPDQLIGLPAPVARYFERVLRPGQRMIGAARIVQRGDFALRRDRWMPFTATEHVSVRPLGFMWDASIRIMPLVAMRVRDSYVEGTGTMDGRLAALVPLVRQSGAGPMAAATLQRYLAEAPWVPTALLPSEGVRWTALDDSSARATITDGDVTASVDFHFDRDDTIGWISADRYRAVGDSLVLTPWRGSWRAYETIDGMLIPREGDVSWQLPDGPHTYWRGRLEEVTYAFGGE